MVTGLFEGFARIGLVRIDENNRWSRRNYNDVFAVCGYGDITFLIYNFRMIMIDEVFHWISSISYKLYLLQMLILVMVKIVFNGGLVMTVVAVPILLFMAWIYKKLIDEFCTLRIKN